MTCRRREQQRRYYHGLPSLEGLPQGLRVSRLKLPPEPVKLAYIAGLFDGEGCITGTHRPGYPVVQVGMTDKDVIDYLGTLGGTRQRCNGLRLPRRFVVLTVMAQAEVEEFLRAIGPYLRVKSHAAGEALDVISARRKGYTSGPREHPKVTEAEGGYNPSHLG